ncbi:MAG: peptide deformylase [Methylomonas sp.]
MIKKPEIVQLGAAVLRKKAQAVDDFGRPEFQQLITTMQDMMHEANGVGIAAPQLGESWQIVIIASRPTARYPNAPEMHPLAMINPRFEVLDAALIKDWEGCLSVPGIRALVPRYRAIKVSYQDAQGLAFEIELQDFPARVFQHEFDHLQGLVYLDRVENNQDIFSESEFFKLINA